MNFTVPGRGERGRVNAGYHGNSYQHKIDNFALNIGRILRELPGMSTLICGEMIGRRGRPPGARVVLTLRLVVDDVFDQQVVVAEDDRGLDLGELLLQRLHLPRQHPDAGNARERRPAEERRARSEVKGQTSAH